jgi:spore germination protein
MFSGNDKISRRQLYRNDTAGLLSMAAFLAPLEMSRTGWNSIWVALLLLGLYQFVVVRVPTPFSYAAKAVCYIHCWLIGTMTVRVTALLIRQFLLTDVSLTLILIPFYLFCFYNVYKGLECRMRVSEILFPFFILLVVLLSVLMLGEADFTRCMEIRWQIDEMHLKTGYKLFAWFSGIQGIRYFRVHLKEHDSAQKTAGSIWAAGAAAAVLWSLFTYSIYGDAGNTGLAYPLASAMTLAHLPGNVIGRLDALFVFAWVIGLFLLCSSLFAPLQAEQLSPAKNGIFVILLAVSCILAMQEDCLDICSWVLYYVSMPLQILCILWQGLGRNGRKRMAAVSVLLLLPFLQGCGSQELEERGLVTALAVDAAEDGFHFTIGFGTAPEGEGEEPFETEASSLREMKEQYMQSGRKQLDFNHLKNLYFSEEVLENPEFGKLLEEIQQDAAYSRGTCVYAVEGEAGEQAEKEEQPEGGIPIHRILNAWYNDDECEIPRITKEQMYRGAVSWP